MDVLNFVVFFLVGLNLFQFWFWSKQNSRLVDKLMSRNYAEYVQAQGLLKPLPMSIVDSAEDDISDDDILNELNGMLPK